PSASVSSDGPSAKAREHRASSRAPRAMVRWRPILSDSPLAPKEGGVNLAAVRRAIRGVEDRLRAGGPSRKTLLSRHLAKQLPLAFRGLTKNHIARSSRLAPHSSHFKEVGGDG